MAEFTVDQAKEVIENGIGQAQELMADPSKVSDLLAQVQNKAKELPANVGEGLTQIPVLASMVKDYVGKSYTEVSPKVIASIVSAFLYVISKKDLISDDIPVLGMVDDVAVVGLALKLCEPELNAYKEWQKSQEA